MNSKLVFGGLRGWLTKNLQERDRRNFCDCISGDIYCSYDGTGYSREGLSLVVASEYLQN